MIDKNRSPIEYHALKKANGQKPVPLKETSFKIEVRSGLAMIEMVRNFKNVEKRPIEAVLTFPVPFDAAVYKLQTKVADRVLTGKAQAKVEARNTYEKAIDEGKPAVLHEELLRGLHMLSVANVAPGVEIEVSMTMTVPLVLADGNGRFRFPLTIGHIYGTLPLEDSDNLLLGGEKGNAKVTITAAAGSVIINGSSVSKGETKVSLSDPLEVEIVGLYKEAPENLVGRAADDRTVTLAFTKLPDDKADVNVDIMIDVSGSMKEKAFNSSEAPTKYEAVMDGLNASANVLGEFGEVSIWSFNDSCRKVEGGKAKDSMVVTLNKVQKPSGGTNLAAAVAHVMHKVPEANILLITDGKSGHQLDIEKAVASGARVTVVLVGSDAMEVNVGYLAAMTGGEMIIARGSAVDEAVQLAIKSMRYVAAPIEQFEGRPEALMYSKAGNRISALWSSANKKSPARDGFAEAIAAYAAHLAIMAMKEEEAAKLSASEGLVSHLTSIVLVDDAAEAVEGIPATRKVALPDASTHSFKLVASSADASMGAMRSFHSASADADFRSMAVNNILVGGGIGGGYVPMKSSDASDWFSSGLLEDRVIEREIIIREKVISPRMPVLPTTGYPVIPMDPLGPQTDVYPGTKLEWPKSNGIWQDFDFSSPTTVSERFESLKDKIDWDSNPEELRTGQIGSLPTWVQATIVIISQDKAVQDLARQLNISAAAVVIALLASQDPSRTAARIARATLEKADETNLDAAKAAVGISS